MAEEFTDHPLRAQWLSVEEAAEEIVNFERRFGEKHLLLAWHAALPFILTPALVNLIRLNFLEKDAIPWYTEADFLLSPLCRSLGGELYQLEPTIREVLLYELEERAGTERPLEIATFLLDYLESEHPWKQREDFDQLQRWIAQAYLHPDLLIAALKSELERSDVTFEPNTSPDLADGLKIAYALELVSTKLEEQQHKLTLQQQEDFQYLQDATRLLAYYWSKDYSKLSQKIGGLKTQTIRKLKKAGSLGSFFEWLVTSNTAAAVAKITPAQQALLSELNDLKTSHKRRRDIGKRLSEIGDPRRGIGLDQNGLPDIEWLPVFQGGQVKIEKKNFKVAPFYIARYPITYAQYDAFVNDTEGFNNPEWWRDMPKEYQMQELYSKNVKPPNYPRDYLSWYQSVAFSRWLYSRLKGAELPNPDNSSKSGWIIGQNAEVRLPTEWEWQWAAQGGREQRQYPWGTWQEGYANTDEAKLNQTVAVGMYPHGAALCKAEDLSGNVWEWCLNEYSSPSTIKINDSTNSRVLRGGSFGGIAHFVASAYRLNLDPSDDYNRSGFRLVVCFPYPASLISESSGL